MVKHETTLALPIRVIERLRGILHNHPKIEYVRLTRREAEALVAAAKAGNS
jgi:predicted DNA binding protein